MKLKDASRLSMLIEGEGYIRVNRPYKRKDSDCLSSPRIQISIANTDLGLLTWAKEVLEKELKHGFKLYAVSNADRRRTRQCYRLVVSRFDDIHRVLNITRHLMVGIKKQIADRICSFLDYRKSKIGKCNYVADKNYTRVFGKLISSVNSIYNTYDRIKPVTTVHSSDLDIDRKIQSELNGNIESSAEMLEPL